MDHLESTHPTNKSFNPETRVQDILKSIPDDANNETLRNFISQMASQLAITENQLRESKQETTRRLQLLDNIEDIVYEIASDGKIIYVNKACESLIGYKPEEMAGQNLQKFLHPADKNKIIEALLRPDNLNGSVFEYRYIKKSGDICWVQSSIFPAVENGRFMMATGKTTCICREKEVEIALSESEEKFHKAFNSFPLSLVIARANDGIFVDVNKCFCENSGYTKEEIIGKTALELSLWAAPQDRNSVIDDLKNGKDLHGLQLNFMKKDGKTVTCLLSSTMISINNEPMFISSMLDISDRIAVEEQLRVKNEDLNAIISAIPDVLFVIDKNGNFREVLANQQIIPYIPSDMAEGKNIASIFTPDTLKMHMDAINACITTKELITYNYELKIKNTRHFFEARLVFMKGDKVLAFIRDISKDRFREMQIKKLSMAVEQNPVPIMIGGLNGKIEYCNKSLCENFGYEKEELIGLDFKILGSDKIPEETYKIIEGHIREGKMWQGELIKKRKNGDIFWADVIINPIMNEKGEVVNFLSYKKDITERKQFESELKLMNQSLEKKIKERTVEFEKVNKTLIKEIEERTLIDKKLYAKNRELENFFEVSLDLLAILDKNGNFLKVNKAWGELLGLPIENIKNHSYTEFVHPDDIKMTATTGKLGNENIISSFINRYRSKDGSYRYLEWKSSPADGVIYAAARDVTDDLRSSKFEKELLELAPKLTDITSSNISKYIHSLLSRIAVFMDADRAQIFEYNVINESVILNFSWSKDKQNASLQKNTSYPAHFFKEWTTAMKINEPYIIYSADEIPDEWIYTKQIFVNNHIKTFITLPIIIENQIAGNINLLFTQKEKRFELYEINNLKVWGNMISSLVKNAKTEKLLEQTRKNYEAFFNTNDDFIFVMDNHEHIVHFNQTVRKRLGYANEELINDKIDKILLLDTTLSNKNIVPTHLLISKKGEHLPVERKIIHGFWNDKPIRFVILKDISEIKRSEEKFSKAFHINSVLMVISNIETGEIYEVNDNFVKTSGWSREEITGKTSLELHLFQNPDDRKKLIELSESGNNVRDVEIQFMTKSGKSLTMLASTYIIYVGLTKSMLKVFVDITERKKAEEDLRIARTEAENANRAKSEFLSRMSHELRTPMNSILGFAQLLSMNTQNKSQKKSTQYILNSGKHLLDLINEVLDLSKIESGTIQLVDDDIDKDKFLQEIINIVNPLAEREKVVINYSSNADNYIFRSDKQRLKQILLNIINNAIKYNRENGNVFIEVTNRDIENKTLMRFNVVDTGIGISYENQQKLFQPFERIDAEKTGIEGTGLGLSVVKKLVELLGGKIGLKSEFGKGSEFWFEIPVTIVTELIAEKTSENIATDNIKGQSEGLILYVEDNMSNLDLVKTILELNRPSIKLINNMYGKNALKSAKMYHPNLILLDLNLPDIDGIEVLNGIVSDNETKNIPVIVISADAMEYRIELLTKHGAKDYITKPFDINRFISIIDKWMK